MGGVAEDHKPTTAEQRGGQDRSNQSMDGVGRSQRCTLRQRAPMAATTIPLGGHNRQLRRRRPGGAVAQTRSRTVHAAVAPASLVVHTKPIVKRFSGPSWQELPRCASSAAGTGMIWPAALCLAHQSTAEVANRTDSHGRSMSLRHNVNAVLPLSNCIRYLARIQLKWLLRLSLQKSPLPSHKHARMRT